MGRTLMFAMAAVVASVTAEAQIYEPVRPIAPTPYPVAPPALPPTTLPLTAPTLPTPSPTPVSPLPVQVVPPAPPAAEKDLPDGDSTCACSMTEQEPVFQNGVIIGTRPVRKLTGESKPECCPN